MSTLSSAEEEKKEDHNDYWDHHPKKDDLEYETPKMVDSEEEDEIRRDQDSLNMRKTEAPETEGLFCPYFSTEPAFSYHRRQRISSRRGRGRLDDREACRLTEGRGSWCFHCLHSSHCCFDTVSRCLILPLFFGSFDLPIRVLLCFDKICLSKCLFCSNKMRMVWMNRVGNCPGVSLSLYVSVPTLTSYLCPDNANERIELTW